MGKALLGILSAKRVVARKWSSEKIFSISLTLLTDSFPIAKRQEL